MNFVLRQALLEKFRGLPEWKEFRGDFEALTGLRVEVVDELGAGLGCEVPICGLVAGRGQGPLVCRQFRRALLEQAAGAGRAVEGQCDAGAWELAAPLQVGGTVAGYLLAGGMVESPEPGRVAHLLRRAGVPVGEREVSEAAARSRQVPARQRRACLRWLDLAARDMTARLTAREPGLPGRVPPPVEKACRWLHLRALEGPVSLTEAARVAHVSPAHLSRLFRKSLGLGFAEYVNRLRARAAWDLLRRTDKPVAEVAMECGFSSLAQFYRVFRRLHGRTPRTARGMAGIELPPAAPQP